MLCVTIQGVKKKFYIRDDFQDILMKKYRDLIDDRVITIEVVDKARREDYVDDLISTIHSKFYRRQRRDILEIRATRLTDGVSFGLIRPKRFLVIYFDYIKYEVLNEEYLLFVNERDFPIAIISQKEYSIKNLNIVKKYGKFEVITRFD